MPRLQPAAGWLLPLLLPLCAAAQSVSMSGSLGDKALLVIDGKPRTVATGNTVQGVKLLSVNGSGAVVEVGGKRVALALGGAQVDLGASGGGDGGGSINGKAVSFLVDTGATNVALSEAVAERIGLDFRKGRQGMSNTANGAVPTHMVSLGVVRIGDVQIYNVEAVIVPAPMETVLLGNSFLTRFQMKRENDTLTLDRRY